MATDQADLTPLLAVASALIVLLNSLICTLVLTHNTLRTCTNGFLVSLALSDVLTGGVLLPLSLAVPTSPVNGYFISIILLSGVANHVAITFDRFVAVCYPFQYSFTVKAYFLRIIAVCWLVAIVISLLPIFWEANPEILIHKVYIFIELVLFILAPYVFVFVAYYRIFKSLREHTKLLQEANISTSRRDEARRVSAEAKVAKVFLVLVLMFVLCWLPIIYMTAVTAVSKFHLIPEPLTKVSLITLALSSLVNPLLYSFMKEDFRNALKKIWPCKREVIMPIDSVTTNCRQVMRINEERLSAASSVWDWVMIEIIWHIQTTAWVVYQTVCRLSGLSPSPPELLLSKDRGAVRKI